MQQLQQLMSQNEDLGRQMEKLVSHNEMLEQNLADARIDGLAAQTDSDAVKAQLDLASVAQQQALEDLDRARGALEGGSPARSRGGSPVRVTEAMLIEQSIAGAC